MASEYYKWLARDVQPEEKKELTPQERRRNWWAYHKWHVIVVLFCLVFAADMAYDMVWSARNQPDYTIAFVATAALPESSVETLETAIAALGEDLNGNGQVRVELVEYVLPEGADPQSAYSHSMRVLMDIESVQSVIFLLEDPEAFAAEYPILTGTPPYHRWADCPVLTGLGLPLDGLYIARRGIWNGEGSDITDGALRLFERLTEGAR